MTTIPLTQIIAELLDSSDRSSHYFRRLYRIGMQVARKFNRDITGEFKTVLLDVSANGTVSWPCDYLDYATLGVVNDNGELVPLRHNEDLSLLKQAYLASHSSVVSAPNIPSCVNGGSPQFPFPFYWLNYWGDAGYIHLYGVGGGGANIGEFTIDVHNKCFYVPSGFGYTSLVLEYLSDGLDPEQQDYMIHIFAIDAVKDCIRWESMRDLPKKYSMSEVAAAKQQYLISRRDCKAMMNKARVSEMQVVFRDSIKLTAKA